MKEYIFQIYNNPAGDDIVVANAPTGLVPKNILAIINKTTGKPVHSPIAEVVNTVTYSGTTMTIALDSGAPSIEGDLLIKAYSDVDIATESSVKDGTYTAIGELRDNNHGLLEIYNDMYKGVQMVSHPTSDTSVTIQPNVFNVWAAVDSNITTSNPMVITKGTDIPTVVNEYQIRIANTNNAAIGVTFSGFSIEWGNGYAPSFNAGFEYDISIVDGVGVWTETQIPSNS